LDYVPLLASEHEARRWLLYPWRMFSPDALVANIDCYVAHELHRQEVRDKEICDQLEALLGKAADWRTALLLEACYNDHARRTLEEILVNVFTGGPESERKQWNAACDAIAKLKSSGPAKLAKATALVFVLACRAKNELLPPRGEILEFLRWHGIKVRPGNAGRDIFTGPILSALRQRRSGRPKKTRQPNKFDGFEN
jgi:hypothetical protein